MEYYDEIINKKDKEISELEKAANKEKNEQLKTDLLNFAIGETSQVNNLNNKEMITPNEEFNIKKKQLLGL